MAGRKEGYHQQALEAEKTKTPLIKEGLTGNTIRASLQP
jgi:hypothetical protein